MRNSHKITLKSFQYFLLAISPILHVYRFMGIITLGEFALITYILIEFLYNKGDFLCYKLKSEVKYASVVVMYYGMITLISAMYMGGSIAVGIKEFVVFFIYYILAFYIIRRCDVNRLAHILNKVSMLVALFIIIQYIFQLLFGIKIYGLVPNMITCFGISTNEYNLSQNTRCSGFFTEPAIAANYLAIPFLNSIFDIKKNDRLISKEFVLYAISLLFTQSGTAVLILGVGILFYLSYFIKKIKTIKRKKQLPKMVGIMLLGVFVIISLWQMPIVQNLLARIAEVSGDSTMKSGYIRITRGFEAYSELSWYQKIVGIGFGQYEALATTTLKSVLTASTDLVLTWLNDCQTYLIYGGIIGLSLYAIFLFSNIRHRSVDQKWTLLLFVALHFITGLYAQPIWILFFVFIFGNENRKVSER